MRIELKEVDLEGYRSYQQRTRFPIDLGGIVLVNGPNGKGKTMVWDALVWVFYGQTIKGLPQDKVQTWEQDRTGDFKGTRVGTRFHKSGVEYEVWRHYKYRGQTYGRKGGSSLMIFEDGVMRNEEMNKKDSEEFVQMILEVSCRVFLRSIMFPQRMASLIKASPEEKRKVFDEIFDMSFLPAAKDKTRKKVNELGGEVSNLEREIENAQKEEEKLKEDIDHAKEQLEHFEERKKEEISDMKERLKQHQKEVKEAKERLKEWEKKMDLDFPAGRLDVDNVENEYKKVSNEIRALEQKKRKAERYLEECRDQLERSKKNKERLESELENLDTECGVCGKDLSFTMESRIKEYKDEIQGEERAIQELEEKQKEAEDPKEYDKQIKEQEEKQKSIKETLDNHKSRDEDYREIEDGIKEAKREIEVSNEYISDLEDRIEKKKNEKLPDYRLEEKKERLEKVREQLTEDRQKLFDKQREFAHYKWWNDVGFAQKGMRAYIFDSMLKVLNHRMEKYASVMGVGVTMDVDMEKDSKPLTTTVYMDSYEVLYDELSGGQQQRVDVCQAFACHDIVADQGFINVLIMDEIFESMDETGIDQVFDLISMKKAEGTIFVITHQEEAVPKNAKEIRIEYDQEERTSKVD